MGKRLLTALAGFLCLFALQVMGTPLILDSHSEHYDDFEVSYLVDAHSRLTIESIQKQTFEKSMKNRFGLAYLRGTLWIRFEILNEGNHREFILSTNESHYERAVLYVMKDTLHIQENGLLMPLSKRAVPTDNLAFTLTLDPGEKATCYVELKGRYAYFGNLELIKSPQFYATDPFSMDSVNLFIFGIFTIIVLFSLFLFMKLKERIYLYYFFFSLFNFIYVVKTSGFLSSVNLAAYIYDLHCFAAFGLGFMLLFVSEFLEIKKHVRRLYPFIKGLVILSFLIGILVVFFYSPFNMLIALMAILIPLMVLVVSIIVFVKGYIRSWYYLFAISIYFFFLAWWCLLVLGYAEYTFWSRYGYIFSLIIEMTIFTFLIANRYFEIKKNIQTYLEDEITKQTKELKTANEQLNGFVGERELLLKELNHRVKNNFHVLIGLLNLETRKLEEGSTKNIFLNLINRVTSMSMIHGSLHEDGFHGYVAIREYVKKILMQSRETFKKGTTIEDSIDDFEICAENAINLGMLINEIMTNIVKHNEQDNLLIQVSLHQQQKSVFLEIRENGKGFDIKTVKKGLGLGLISQLTEKLPKGQCRFEDHGRRFVLEYEES